MSAQLIKKALIRDGNTPVGRPAELYIQCCGLRIVVPKPFDRTTEVECPACRAVYDGSGYQKNLH